MTQYEHVYGIAQVTHLGKLLDVTFVVSSISDRKSLEPIWHIISQKMNKGAQEDGGTSTRQQAIQCTPANKRARSRAHTHTHITTTLEKSFRWEPSHIRPANVCMCAMCKCASVRESLRRLIDAIERPGFSVHEVGLGFRV